MDLHATDALTQSQMKEQDGGWMAMLDTDGDGKLTERERGNSPFWPYFALNLALYFVLNLGIYFHSDYSAGEIHARLDQGKLMNFVSKHVDFLY